MTAAPDAEATGGRRILICLGEARDLLARLCHTRPEIIDIQTRDGRPALITALPEPDAQRILQHPLAHHLILSATRA